MAGKKSEKNINGKKVGYLEIGAAFLAILFSFAVSGYLTSFTELSFIGAFLVAFFSSATVLLPAPGLAIIVGFGRTLNPVLLGVCAGLGAGIGEFTGYLLGKGGKSMLESHLNKNKKAISFSEKQAELVKKYSSVAVFILALIPNPFFDIVGLAAGAIKMPWWKFLAATIAGNIIKYCVLAYLGKLSLVFV